MKNHDPKLREAMVEIEEVLKRYDIGGYVILQSNKHAEFKFCIETPTWSNLRFVKEGEAWHIKLYSKSDRENTNATVAMLYSIRDLCALGFQTMSQAAVQIEQHVKVEHIVFGPNGISQGDE